MKKSKKIILIITIILLIVLAIFTGIKIYQYNTVMKITDAVKAKRESLDFLYEINEENVTYRVYAKNDKVKQEILDENGNIEQINYTDTSIKTTYFLDIFNKVYTTMTDSNYSASFINTPNSLDLTIGELNESLTNKIKLALSIKSISHETLDNKDTLKIDYNYTIEDDALIETVWYDAITLYPVKVVSNFDPNDATYTITDCPLSEEEITFTNKEGYTEVTNDGSEIESSEENKKLN